MTWEFMEINRNMHMKLPHLVFPCSQKQHIAGYSATQAQHVANASPSIAIYCGGIAALKYSHEFPEISKFISLHRELQDSLAENIQNLTQQLAQFSRFTPRFPLILQNTPKWPMISHAHGLPTQNGLPMQEGRDLSYTPLKGGFAAKPPCQVSPRNLPPANPALVKAALRLPALCAQHENTPPPAARRNRSRSHARSRESPLC